MMRRLSFAIFCLSTLGLAQITTYEVPVKLVPEGTFSRPIVSEMRVLFDDLLPGANWGHPARYRLLDRAGKVLETVDVRMPPKSLRKLKLVSGLEVRWADPVKFKIKTFSGKYKVKNPESHVALLINGQSEMRHWNDFSYLYRVLTSVYGYSKENILVADSAFREEAPDLDGDGTADIHHDSSVKEVRALIESLKTRARNGNLLIVINDHGENVKGESTILLEDGSITAKEFAALLDDLELASILSIFEQCYGGGFVRPTVKKGRVSMAASTDIEESWASVDLKFDEFLYNVTSAFGRQTHLGKAVEADLNGDDFISAKEAFSYAVGAGVRPESPLLETAPNAKDAFSLGFYRLLEFF